MNRLELAGYGARLYNLDFLESRHLTDMFIERRSFEIRTGRRPEDHI